ncbi:MAG: hypothetical protein JWR44_2432 [Hymenobacter sp.]|jgi:hypothetical protein|nr:hypothetical protein [Hymenobacter sp.]
MPKALKNHEEKQAYKARLEVIRPDLPEQPGSELASFCRYTQRPVFNQDHVWNVLRQPIRRYDDEILKALEAMVKSLKLAA